MRETARAHEHDAEYEDDDAENGDRSRRLSEGCEGDQGGDQGRKAAHHRIGDGEVGSAIEPPHQQKIDNMDERRGDDERGRRARGPRKDEGCRKSRHAAPERDESGRQEFVVGALDERIPQRMKERSAENRGQNA